MTSNFMVVLALVLLFIWNVSVWGVIAYVVFWLGYSGWWFLLALFLSISSVSLKGYRK